MYIIAVCFFRLLHKHRKCFSLILGNAKAASVEGKEWTKVFPVFCSPRLQPSKPSRDRRRRRGEKGASFSFFPSSYYPLFPPPSSAPASHRLRRRRRAKRGGGRENREKSLEERDGKRRETWERGGKALLSPSPRFLDLSSAALSTMVQ